MSVVVESTSLLTIAPGVAWVDGVLHVRTSRLLQVLGLGSYARHVSVDPRRRELVIRTRRLWVWRAERIIPFDDIAYLTYGFGSIATSWTRVGMRAVDTADQLESFRIGIGLHDTFEEIPLCAFRGEGSASSGWYGVAFGDDLLDLQGDQGDASLKLIEVLEKLIGVRIGRPLLDREAVRVCQACGLAGERGKTRCSCGGVLGNVR